MNVVVVNARKLEPSVEFFVEVLERWDVLDLEWVEVYAFVSVVELSGLEIDFCDIWFDGHIAERSTFSRHGDASIASCVARIERGDARNERRRSNFSIEESGFDAFGFFAAESRAVDGDDGESDGRRSVDGRESAVVSVVDEGDIGFSDFDGIDRGTDVAHFVDGAEVFGCFDFVSESGSGDESVCHRCVGDDGESFSAIVVELRARATARDDFEGARGLSACGEHADGF